MLLAFVLLICCCACIFVFYISWYYWCFVVNHDVGFFYCWHCLCNCWEYMYVVLGIVDDVNVVVNHYVDLVMLALLMLLLSMLMMVLLLLALLLRICCFRYCWFCYGVIVIGVIVVLCVNNVIVVHVDVGGVIA